MPGMMDTVLNLGLNDATVEGLGERVRRRALRLGQLSPLHPDVRQRRARRRPPPLRGDPRARQARRRRDRGHRSSTAEDWQPRGRRLQGAWSSGETGKPFPQDPQEQLWGAIGAVFGTWMNPRANTYRRLHDIPAELGHRGQRAGHGVRQHGRGLRHRRLLHPRSRRPARTCSTASTWSTRRARTWSPASARRSRCRKPRAKPGELPHGRGDARRLRRAADGARRRSSSTTATCRTSSSPCSRASCTCCRPATASAPPRPRCSIAVDMAREGLIDQQRGGAARQSRRRSTSCCIPTLDPKAPRTLLAKGLPASPGAACGRGRVHRRRGREPRRSKGEAVILVRIETSPEDIHGMHAARGILTTRGGMTSHAAVVARGMGRPCVAGAGGISRRLRRADAVGRRQARCSAGEIITLDGATGEVFVGAGAR